MALWISKGEKALEKQHTILPKSYVSVVTIM